MKKVSSLRIFQVVLYAALLATSGYVIVYYWQSNHLKALTRLPQHIMVLCLVYVLLQVIKRLFVASRNWWDWLYYIGLIAAVLPTYFATSSNAASFHWFTDLGTPFLALPVLLDSYQFFKKTP
jgi:hypothetical protein